jgi:plasmid stabilization system protein ParE
VAAELIFAPEAEQDIASAYHWYEGQRAGLGEEFLRCLDACLQATLRHPELHPVVRDDFRRALVRRFPYAVFYEYAVGVVAIHGVFHTSRDPNKWRQRLA